MSFFSGFLVHILSLSIEQGIKWLLPPQYVWGSVSVVVYTCVLAKQNVSDSHPAGDTNSSLELSQERKQIIHPELPAVVNPLG